MPATREALAEGELAESAVALLVSARETNSQEFAEAESLLVEAARELEPRDLRRAVAYWREAADQEEALLNQERAWERRRLHVSQTMFGMVRVDGDLDPETGQTLISALRAVQDADARNGDSDASRTPAQRRADALHELCRQWLDRVDRPFVAGERPHLNVLVDLQAIEGKTGRTCELEDVGPVHPEMVRRLACDASVSRVIVQGLSEPLDVGRRTAVVPAGIRRALIVRDRHCRFPGCGRPPSWCDGHHVVHWADGGETAPSNLVLLCRRHHRMVHLPSCFQVRMREGKPSFERPDGTLLEDRAPPPV
jgi:hypothetical protein